MFKLLIMKKVLFTIVLLITWGGHSQSSSFEISYVPDFGKTLDITGNEVGFIQHNINFNFNFLSWGSRFQLGPLLSFSHANKENTYLELTELAIGMSTGYSINEMFSFKLDISSLTYEFFKAQSTVIKPSLEYNIYNNWAIVVGVVDYGTNWPGDFRVFNNADNYEMENSGPRILAGVKYKF